MLKCAEGASREARRWSAGAPRRLLSLLSHFPRDAYYLRRHHARMVTMMPLGQPPITNAITALA